MAQGERLEQEGFEGFRSTFGREAFALHHRFYLHLDGANRIWLSAEDGCEGTPAAPVRALWTRCSGVETRRGEGGIMEEGRGGDNSQATGLILVFPFFSSSLDWPDIGRART